MKQVGNDFDDFSTDLKYDNEVYDIDDFQESIRLKPDFYIHLCLQQLTKVFEGDIDEVQGFKKYNHLVGHIEILVRSAKMLPKDYEDKLKEVLALAKEKNLGKVEEEAFIAREKLNLFIGNVFSSAPARGALYLYENNDKSTSRQNETYKRELAKKKSLVDKKL